MNISTVNEDAFSRLVVIGASWGGVDALRVLLQKITVPFNFAIVVVIHQDRSKKSALSQIFTEIMPFSVLEAGDKQPLVGGEVYVSTPNYHLLVEQNGTLSHTVDRLVNYSRPSIDVLFHTAADAYGDRVVAAVLTGANKDGAEGARSVKQRGGRVFVQDPKEAEAKAMPLATIDIVDVDFIGDLDALASKLNALV